MIRKPKSFNCLFVTRHFFRDYLEHNTIARINEGRCYDYAYFAYRMFPNVKLWTTDYHAWIEHKNKFYDSQSINGVEDYMRLACNRQYAPKPWEEQPPVKVNVNRFKSMWDNWGGGRRRHWDSHLERDLKYVLGYHYSELTPIFKDV